MIERVGPEMSTGILEYLRAHAFENIMLLNDLGTAGNRARLWSDDPTLIGYRHRGRLIAVQGHYRYGRWYPHFESEQALDDMLDDIVRRHRQAPRSFRWIMGIGRVVDPILTRLDAVGLRPSYDEKDHLSAVDLGSFRPHSVPGVRRATLADVKAIADLRLRFEVEYFGVPAMQVNISWCVQIARRYVLDGVYLAERDGQAVAMVAVEARIPQVSQIAAVFTRRGFRSRGLAKGVVSAICEEELATAPLVALTVRKDNLPALKAYADLGFRPYTDYRMSNFRQDP